MHWQYFLYICFVKPCDRVKTQDYQAYRLSYTQYKSFAASHRLKPPEWGMISLLDSAMASLQPTICKFTPNKKIKREYVYKLLVFVEYKFGLLWKFTLM